MQEIELVSFFYGHIGHLHELALCREKLWNAALFQRAWDHFKAKLG